MYFNLPVQFCYVSCEAHFMGSEPQYNVIQIPLRVGPNCSTSFIDNPMEILALPSNTTPVIFVVLVSLKTAWCGKKNSIFASPLESSLVPREVYFHIPSWNCGIYPRVLDLLSVCIKFACTLRSAERREDPSCLEPIFAGSLTVTLRTNFIINNLLFFVLLF